MTYYLIDASEIAGCSTLLMGWTAVVCEEEGGVVAYFENEDDAKCYVKSR
jgi:hypothetical protein|tara:strand:+ start:303 stop:452 length:150 start_codon:yes stop_codon:yes gene_type:complete